LTRRLAQMAWPEVADAVKAGAMTVFLPLGATEQHGPHLPLGTDTVRASALAERLAERLGPGFLVAPALPFGCCDEHAGFPGLLGLQHETLARVIVDLARRLTGWGVRRPVLLSAHGGNGGRWISRWRCSRGSYRFSKCGRTATSKPSPRSCWR
jgi:creatinine amidohydrolase